MAILEETQHLTAGFTPSVEPKRSGRSSTTTTTTKTIPNASHAIQMPPTTTTTTNNNKNTATVAATAPATTETTPNASHTIRMPSTTTTNNNPSTREPTPCEQVAASIFLILAITGLIWLLIWAIVRTDDSYKTPEFRVDSVFTSPFNASSYQTTISSPSYNNNNNNNNWNMSISFVAKNPKTETALFYDMLRASLFYEKELLSVTDMGAFYQETGDQTVVNATFKTSYDTNRVDNWVVAAIDGSRKQGKALKFNVLVQARARLHGSTSDAEENWLTVDCSDIKVQFLPKPTTVAKRCHVILKSKDDGYN